MTASDELDQLLVYWAEDQVILERDFGCDHPIDDEAWDETDDEGYEGICRAYWLGEALVKRERIHAELCR